MFYFLTAVIGVAFASLFEWTLHRFFMHKPFFKYRYPYERHTLTHHRIFKADHTYHLQDTRDKKTIPMAWWNCLVLVSIGTIMTIPFSLYFQNWWISVILAIEFAIYYGVYERIHWCMHLPKDRKLERNGIFFRLNGHHLLHHRYHHRNFNVVLPLADLCLLTLLLRSKSLFKQPTHPVVPIVTEHFWWKRGRLKAS